MIREDLEVIVDKALAAAVEDGSLSMDSIPEAALERPRDLSNGDWASTVAMRSSKLARKNPREIADIIVAHLPENDMIDSVNIAGPGFINFMLSAQTFQNVIEEVRREKGRYGSSVIPDGPYSINLEYISANPTGPMHVGHGRWAALGSATANVLRHAGYKVTEEFYINDQGNQMNVFGNSIAIRYQQILGRDVIMPENSYGGAYVKDIAQAIIDADGDKWLDVPAQERLEAFREKGYELMLANVRETLDIFGTSFDVWFSERSLFVPDEAGLTAIDKALEAMRKKGYIYESEGATWFRSTAFEDEKDRVLIKENGDYTYFMSDIAYHYNKVNRGYDHLIDIWGADHHGYIARCEAMMSAWGKPGMLEIMLGQLVNLFREGEAVRMSKRTGEMITFRELIDEVGADATKYLMLSHSSDQQIDFDIEVAKKKDSTNPVYYVQYAHARICSILRKAYSESEGADDMKNVDKIAARLIPADVDLSVLIESSEIDLMRKMADFTDLVRDVARDRAPFRLTHFAQDLASTFHSFYTECHVLVDDKELCNARLALCDAARINLALALELLGVSAPESM